MLSLMCSRSCSSSLGNSNVALLLHAADAPVEDDVGKVLQIDVVQNEEGRQRCRS